MRKNELQDRTKQFHVEIIKFCNDFPKTVAGFEIAKQIIRSAGSVASNYRACGRAKSKADFIYKIQVVLEEADESLYWLEVIYQTQLKTGNEVTRLLNEANELTAIFSAAVKTARCNSSKSEVLRSQI